MPLEPGLRGEVADLGVQQAEAAAERQRVGRAPVQRCFPAIGPARIGVLGEEDEARRIVLNELHGNLHLHVGAVLPEGAHVRPPAARIAGDAQACLVVPQVFLAEMLLLLRHSRVDDQARIEAAGAIATGDARIQRGAIGDVVRQGELAAPHPIGRGEMIQESGWPLAQLVHRPSRGNRRRGARRAGRASAACLGPSGSVDSPNSATLVAS